MPANRVKFLHWAKTHAPARYELSLSGVAQMTTKELDFTGELGIELTGPYGHPDLLDLIATTYGVAPENVLPVPGTSAANYIALAGTVSRGQRVLVESPAYESLIRIAELQDLEIVRFERRSEDGFRPDLDHIQRELTQGAKAVITSDLHNPSASRWAPDDLMQLAGLCARHSAVLLIDEVYRDFLHVNRGLPRGTAATLGVDVIATASLTKVYGLGGLRAGWILASPDRIKQFGNVLDHMSVHLPAPVSSLAIHAFRKLDRLAERTRSIYQHTQPVFSKWLASRPDLTGYADDGAVFAYLRLPQGVDSDEFCTFLLEEHDTQIVPGSFFGDADHVRIGFGLPPEKVADLTEGLSRIGHALDQFPARNV